MAYSAEESSPAACVTETCCICDEEFESEVELTNHLIEHTNEDKFKTLVAELETKNGGKNIVSTPIRVVNNRPAVPEFTRTSFVREPPLRKKPEVVTPAEPEVWEIVSDDDSNENQESNPKKAKLSNSFRLVSSGGTNNTSESGPPFHCHSCSSVFNDPVAFREHLLTHEKPRPYVCHICKKSFAYKGTLRQHLHLHISDKAHECRVCHKKFSIKSLLKKHEETHEMHLQEQRNNKTS